MQEEFIDTELLDAVELYLAVSGLSGTRFGVLALNDRTFVGRLRRGGNFGQKKRQKAFKYIKANPVKLKRVAAE
ncbi:hypothetical protein [Ruegeria sp. HKCCD6109]|uniref:hypothetical protein n=1 Tax=Ruegeria sp. HKCCD6109 TaxID=2683017 RepID=UPI001492160C|nr:hypothetical protein [Ruegeria sp. HKCCD6109]NOD65790.1 hypothetical protein [Ruegeria sp. HKCCD6109]